MALIKYNHTPAAEQGNHVSRRAILALPAIVAGCALPASAATPQETPVMALFREWERLLAIALRDGCTEDGDADDRYWAPVFETEDRMMATPSQGPLDWIAKALAKSNNGRVELDSRKYNPALWAEARDMLAA